MSVRVVARIRPSLPSELEKDRILSVHHGSDDRAQVVKIPNPKNPSEEYSFQFSSVYDQASSQQDLFENEIAPTVKHLVQGYDVTVFAYGNTGTGKTHTMRGGKTLVDRGMIPRLLSSLFRKSKTLEKNGQGQTSVDVSMSYYEIYNDRVFDLFETPDKRTATGLPIREAEGGKTVICGLTEVECSSLKDFEVLYDKANLNRSVGATKLNAHSSRSHAVLSVKVTITTSTETRVSTVSAIDLAGSEDNRRTGNGKERMVESASINKSLFVLAQCVEAISRKQQRIPYRESKMTRILGLGQNNGFTVMILNLAPTRAYHLDTLSSLNFANRTKKIEVREVENEPIFKGPPRPAVTGVSGNHVQRQPLRQLNNSVNINLAARAQDAKEKQEKPAKMFSVYSDRSTTNPRPTATSSHKPVSPLKRPAEGLASTRPLKQARPTPSFIRRGPETTTITKATLESMVEQKVSEILAAQAKDCRPAEPKKDISAEVQARLDSIEKRLEGQEGERAEGLSYLFMAKQHQARGEDSSALKMYELARPFFEGNEKLERKIEKLRAKMAERRPRQVAPEHTIFAQPEDDKVDDGDESFRCREEDEDNSDADEGYSNNETAATRRKKKVARAVGRPKPPKRSKARASSPDPLSPVDDECSIPTTQTARASLTTTLTPRTKSLIDALNTRDVVKLKTIPGLGTKKADAVAEFLTRDEEMDLGVASWKDVLNLDIKGIGKRSWEVMREGMVVST